MSACADCRFFVPSPAAPFGVRCGECRIRCTHPVYPKSRPFPEVRDDDWCGDFSERPDERMAIPPGFAISTKEEQP